MAKLKELSVAQIDAHVEKLKSAKAAGKFDLKKTYTLVRPILVFLSGFIVLFKKTWAAELVNFIRGMDAYTEYKEPVFSTKKLKR